jgi:hypothetical protein
MVDGRVVKIPRGGHRCFKNSTFGINAGTWLNWRPSGATRGNERQLVEKVGEWVCDKPTPSRL